MLSLESIFALLQNLPVINTAQRSAEIGLASKGISFCCMDPRPPLQHHHPQNNLASFEGCLQVSWPRTADETGPWESGMAHN